MDIEFFIHGVPNGESVYGVDEEKEYLSTSFRKPLYSDEDGMLIHVRDLKNKRYCYYHYLIYKSEDSSSQNMVDSDGREGSYLGITMRMDAYCKDVANIYRIFDMVYHSYILGKWLTKNKSKLKYTISNFSSVSDQIKVIFSEMGKMIQNTFTDESFVSLNGFDIKGKCEIGNLYDYSDDVVLSKVKQYGMMKVSPHYPKIKERQIIDSCNKQIAEVQQSSKKMVEDTQESCKNDIENMKRSCEENMRETQKKCNQTILEKDNQLESCKVEYENKMKTQENRHNQEKETLLQSQSGNKKRIEDLEKQIKKQIESSEKQKSLDSIEINRLKSELNKYKNSKSVKEIVEPIVQPIADLDKILQRIFPLNNIYNQDKTKESKQKINIYKILPRLCLYLNFIILIILMIFMLKMGKNIKKLNESSAIAKMEVVESMDKNNGVTSTASIIVPNNSEKQEIDKSKCRIDVENYDGNGDLSMNQQYTLKLVIIEPGIVVNSKEWKVDGGEIDGADNGVECKFRPTSKDVKIKCVLNGNVEIERNLTAR